MRTISSILGYGILGAACGLMLLCFVGYAIDRWSEYRTRKHGKRRLCHFRGLKRRLDAGELGPGKDVRRAYPVGRRQPAVVIMQADTFGNPRVFDIAWRQDYETIDELATDLTTEGAAILEMESSR